MDQLEKNKLLEEARQRLEVVIPVVTGDFEYAKDDLEKKQKEFQRAANAGKAEEQLIVREQLVKAEQRTAELTHLKGSPYFFRCDVVFEGRDDPQILYFARFPFTEQQIYSWVTPAAAIRFENPGPFSYIVSETHEQRGVLLRKDQFMIVDGQIRFMATESKAIGRELVYQEYLSQRKSAFILPEIVEQMERAQDQVVRAHYQGSFLIAGPAGSGKTTLALHRVAFLAQSPDTSQLFLGESIIVFVQDARTKAYFSSLLPQLGIDGVVITTFAEWAFERLELAQDIQFVTRFGESEEDSDDYEHAKYQALQNLENFRALNDSFMSLSRFYEQYLSGKLWTLWQLQSKSKLLDRFDLTLLLKSHLAQSKFTKQDVKINRTKIGRVKRSYVQVPLEYALVVVDEAENYLAEQIEILHTCIHDKTKAMLYVGDLAQQTQLCTLRDWTAIGEQFHQQRKVVLQKVYRSTRQILEYISSVGYDVVIPHGLRTGNEVNETRILSADEELKHIVEILEKNNETVVGVMAKTKEYLSVFQHLAHKYSNVHILTINEAQGVEFDVACLVGVNKATFLNVRNHSDNAEHFQERRRVNRDLIYVALTRAMNELYVFGADSLQSIVAEL